MSVDIYSWDKGRVVPTISPSIVAEIIDNDLDTAFDLYCGMMDIRLKPWQRSECICMIKFSKYLINWGRGMSKTFLFVLVAVFLALYDMRIIYLVPRVDELEQPMQYFNANAFVDTNPYKHTDKTYSIKKGMWYYILGKPMIKISNIDDKGFNVSSGRFNVTMYDECALLMYYAKEVELFNKAAGMLRAMDYPHRIWASTPLIGSHFVTMKEDMQERNPELVSWRNFENTPDNFLTDTEEKLAQILDEKEDAKRQGILYAWETENLALPRTAMGAAFMNFVEEPFEQFAIKKHNRVGFDWHGYQEGHWWVALGYAPEMYPDDVFVIAEGNERYDKQAHADESVMFLAKPFFSVQLYGEGDISNMVNGPFLKASQAWGVQPVDITTSFNWDANMLYYTWHIDKRKTPEFYKDFTEAEWADPNKFLLHKEASGQKFRNHRLDAAKVATPQFKGGRGIYIPNKRLNRVLDAYELDRLAHRR